MAKSVQVRYFAILREQRGLDQETVATEAGNPTELYLELCTRHGLKLPRERLRVAVNDEFASWGVPLRDGDAVAFIPPVAGG
jgi:molybdopterin converting factor subunit 1